MNPNGAASGNGQAPTASDPAGGNGQAPTPAQANNGAPASPAGSAANGQAPTPTSANDTAAINADDAKRLRQELEEARREAAALRTEKKQRDDAAMSAEQKRERDLGELQIRAAELELRNQRNELKLAGYDAAAKLGIGDMSAALAILQVEHATEVEYDANTGAPTNIEKLLGKVLAAHPSLAAASANGNGQQRPAVGSGGATNPGASARPGTFTREQIKNMSPQEYERNQAAIHEALKQGAIRP